MTQEKPFMVLYNTYIADTFVVNNTSHKMTINNVGNKLSIYKPNDELATLMLKPTKKVKYFPGKNMIILNHDLSSILVALHNSFIRLCIDNYKIYKEENIISECEYDYALDIIKHSKTYFDGIDARSLFMLVLNFVTNVYKAYSRGDESYHRDYKSFLIKISNTI